MELLSGPELDLLGSARRAVLATTRANGAARLVPITYAVLTGRSKELVLYSALDEKPKSVADPRALARVRDIMARPHVTVLVDRWSEEWAELAWLRLQGVATLLEPASADGQEHARAVTLLRERYPQYANQRLEDRPVIRIAVERVVSWGLAR